MPLYLCVDIDRDGYADGYVDIDEDGQSDGYVGSDGVYYPQAREPVYAPSTSNNVLVPSLDCPRDPRCGNNGSYQGEAIICATANCNGYVRVVDCSTNDCRDYLTVIECGVLGCQDDLDIIFGPGVADCPIGGCVGQDFDFSDDFTGDCTQSVTSRCAGGETLPGGDCPTITGCGSSRDEPGGSVLSRDDPYEGGLPGSCSVTSRTGCD